MNVLLQQLTQPARTRARHSSSLIEIHSEANEIVTSIQMLNSSKDRHQKLGQRYLCQMRGYQQIKALNFSRQIGDVHPKGIEESDRHSHIGDRPCRSNTKFSEQHAYFCIRCHASSSRSDEKTVNDQMAKQFAQRIDALRTNIAKVYGLLWGQCTTGIQAEIKSEDVYNSKAGRSVATAN